ncbi:5-formyltetrahydrofolate cyclo-ligase [bacterium HR30]|nr:5-formyltetrahydrofolate cyclo-ligase [bacterium HR30]
MCDCADTSREAPSKEQGETSSAGLGSLKPTVRSLLRAVRRELHPWVVEQSIGYAVAQQAANGEDLLAADGVLLYLAQENEVPTGLLICKAVAAGLPVFLPVSVEGGWTVAQWYPGSSLRRGKFGLWEPLHGASDVCKAGRLVAYVPVVAWARNGVRLGRGAGVYDRLLAGLGEKVTLTVIGLAYEFQQVPYLPRDPWDVPVHKIVTERRVVVCPQGG